mmetsp:Transcript_35684/g.100319  ORF Transcript_35684/g.100319 Transcript_35684/m.100319 type:complete len:173 (+) Transcript_35684:98-616(+)
MPPTRPLIKPLPVREMKEMMYTGCSKRRSHRALPEFQQFDIPYKFPRFPQIMGEWIVRRIKRGETNSVRDHPCSKVFDSFLDCVRRHPDTYEKKCRVEAGRCIMCENENKGWKAPIAYGYMRYLEHFRVFSEGSQSHDEGPGKYRYEEKTPTSHGRGTVIQFADPPRRGGPR